MRLGLQLFTLRGELADGLPAVLQRVAEMGFDGVETAGLWGHAAADFKAMLDDAGLVPIASHIGLPDDPQFDADLESHAVLGIDSVVTGILPEHFDTADAIARAADGFNAAAARARSRGLRLGYHNHWWEMQTLPDGRRAYDVLFEALDPAVIAEVDIYWVQTGGADPGAVIAGLGGRARLIHVKDGPCVQGEPMTAVGDGVVRVTEALDAASSAEWWIVELDACATDMFTAVERSLTWLRSRIAG